MKKKGQALWMVTIAASLFIFIVLIALFYFVWIPNQQSEEDLEIQFSSREAQIVLNNFLRSPILFNSDDLPDTEITVSEFIRKAINEDDFNLFDLLETRVNGFFSFYEKKWRIEIWLSEDNKWRLAEYYEHNDFNMCPKSRDDPFARGVILESYGLFVDCLNTKAYQVIPNYKEAKYDYIAIVLITDEKVE